MFFRTIMHFLKNKHIIVRLYNYLSKYFFKKTFNNYNLLYKLHVSLFVRIFIQKKSRDIISRFFCIYYIFIPVYFLKLAASLCFTFSPGLFVSVLSAKNRSNMSVVFLVLISRHSDGSFKYIIILFNGVNSSQ